MNNTNFIFLDLDGVLVTSNQLYTKKLHPKYGCPPFDKKCVKIFNEILEKTNSTIILSSDWKYHYNQAMINEIFKWNNIKKPISNYTPSLWGIETSVEFNFKSLDDLEKCRATEIIHFTGERKLNNIKWVAIDDLDLNPFLPDKNFVQTPRISEGIKQTGIKEKILKRLL